MRAIAFERHGGPEVLKPMVLRDPTPSNDEALIRVLATSLNRIDAIIRRGYPGIPIKLPHVPGADIVGIIERFGDGSSSHGEFRVGDMVLVNNVWGCGHCDYCRAGAEDHCIEWRMPGFHEWGGYGELVRVPIRALVKPPGNFSVNELAALPLAYGVSWKALRMAQVSENQWVVVIGGSGSIGTALVILAKALGARVIAVSKRGGDVLKSLGADYVVGYEVNEIMGIINERTCCGADVVIDALGYTLPMATQLIKPGGVVVTFGILGDQPNVQLNVRGFYLRHTRMLGMHNSAIKWLRELLDFMSSRGLRPYISKVVSITEVPEMHRLMEGRGIIGKVVMVHEWG
ncbi:alcohol dehydrogenase catalytic domain-containing protein [Vulcanisaeta thermophila]|uniref:alcohol dehydrogenase catalytic domain-containing protein n=1 Tax=Vulcanisaeta thermophila TaxID=867917 RepID=UPI0008533D94|nr:alcohol dehydrogenase catalytic domain-containing protein [Vulcanisaeta thermophila]